MKSAVAKRVERRQLCYIVFTVVCALALSGCAGLQGSSSAPKPDTTPPTAPASLTATATQSSSINLTWTASTDNVGVAGYKVERCSGAGCVNFGQIAAPTATSFDDSGLAPSTAYSYRVWATDAAGNNSAYSNIFSTTTLAAPDTTPPTAPSNLTATASSATQVNLAWTTSTDNVGVTGYKVERCSGTGCASFAQIAASTGTTFNDTGLSASTSYSYRVRATDAAGSLSGYSNTSSAATPAPPDTTPPTAPSNLTATASSATQVNLAWTTSTDNVGVTGYKVERCSGTGCASFAQIAASTGTTFNDTGLSASTSYSYRVRATDAAGNLSGYSNTSSATTPAPPDTTPPTAPTNLTATAALPTQINLAWTASTDNVGVTGYLVERCSGTGCASFAQIAAPTGTTFNDTGLTASTSYSYRVRATDAAGNLSGYSSTSSATTPAGTDTTPPTAPTNLTATAASSSQINLAWTASTDNVGVTGYRVERCSGTGCASFAQIAAPTGTTFNDTGLSASTSYSYRVRATDAAGNLSGYSNTSSAVTPAPPDTTPPTAPSNLTATASSATQVNLAWTASTDNVGVTGYLVERCSGTGCASFAQIAAPTGTTFNDTGLTASTSYSYRVRATDAAGNLSGYSSTSSATTPAGTDTTPPTAPTNLTATAASSSQINLAWTTSTDNVGVTGYKVERCSGTGCANFVQIATPTTTTLNDTGLTASTSYSYRVRATDAAGNLSGYSNTSSAATPAPPDTTPPTAPTNLTATAALPTQINLAWTTSTDNVGVTGYKVERCSGTGCASFAQIAASTGTTFNDTGLSASTSYSYRVRATDAAGNLSGYSNTSSAVTPAPPDTTPPTAPSNLTATASSATQVNLAWTASTDNVGVTGYLVERCSGTGCASFAQIAAPTGTTFNDTGLTASTSYSYRVRATDAAGNLSGYSSTSSATTPAGTDTTPPTAPTNLTATAASSSQINLAWTASTDNVGVTGYRVERCSGAACANFAQIATSTATTFNDTGLTASTSYSYRVRATDAAGNLSGYSNTATTSTSATGNISVTISPRRGGMTTAQSLPFTATVSNDVGAAGVTWSTTGGTLTSQTLTGATFSSTIAGAFTITAKSNADNTQSAAATIGVTDLAGVSTYHNNLARDGTNTREFALTPSNVNSSSFGKLFSCAVDGDIYAQPLWVPNLSIGGGTHNVVLVATQNDSVYAFDADAKPCVQYWKKSFLSAGVTPVPPGDTGEAFDINTKIGITGTPVIDLSSNTLYVVAKTKEGTANYHQRLHALDIINNGNEKFGGPVDITAAITVSGSGDTGDTSVGCTSTAGNVPFCPLREGQRAGLALSGGNIYVAWASHGDIQPYHGWIMAFNAATLARTSTFNDSPNGRESGIWMSGGAPAFDSANNLYVITGNGDYDGINDFGDSILRLNSSLILQDWFTPNVQATLDGADLDLGSGGAVVLADLPSSSVQHILIGGGKGTNTLGQLYVINRDAGMMGQNATPDKSVQQFNLNGMIYSTAAFWQNTMYISAVGQPLGAYVLNPSNSTFTTTPAWLSAHSFQFPGATPSISSQNNAQGIVWALDTNSTTAANASGANGPAILFAYDPQNSGALLFHSDSNGATNAAGNAVKFAVPTVANGKVYVGTQTELTVYGLLP